MTNCNNEESIMFPNSQIVTASIEGEGNTRSNVTDEGGFTWSKGDVIGVYSTRQENPWLQSTPLAQGGQSTASFTITYPNGVTANGYAVYPYSASHSVDNEALSINLPSVYDYSSVDYSENTNAPMVATFTEAKPATFEFKHVGAVIRFIIENVPVGASQFVFTAINNKITGDFSLDNGMISTSSSAENNSVTIKFKELTAVQSSMKFFVPVPTGEYEDMKVEIKKADGTVVLESSSNNSTGFSIERKDLKLGPTIVCSNGVMESTPATDAIDASNKLASDAITSVKVQSVNANDQINIPAKSETAADVEHAIELSALPESGTVKINVTEGDNSTNYTVESLTIVVPDGSSASGLQINAPGTTVTIKGESGTVIAKIEASTAENTLIIGKGVTVEELIVTAGNVRIEGGKITTSITNANSKEIVYVITDQTDADTYNGLSDDIKASITKIECASDIWVEVNTASELYAASLGAKNIKLGADITITADKPVNPKNGQTYDLNNHKVEVANGTKDVFRIEEANAVVTILNGTIDNKNGNNYALSIRADYVTLNMKGVTIPANGYDGSLHKNGNSEGCTVNLGDCNFNGVVYLSNTNNKTANSLKVTGGSFTSTKQNCFELLNTKATITGATLTNTLKTQSYNKNGNEGNNFSQPLGFCIAFTNNDGEAAIGYATLSGNTYSVADENGSYIFNQMNGATLNMEVSRFKEFAEVAAAGGEIILLNDIEDAVGLSINKNLTVDFNNKTYTMSKPGAGSAGTQTLGFQLLKGNKIIFNNGTIKCSVANKNFTWESNAAEKGIAMMIQNYANLTLEGMTIDGTNIAHNGNNTRYIVSFNSDVNLIGKTNIIALGKDVAFDVCQYSSYPAPVVNVETKGTIQGLVEVSGGTLNVKAGTFKNENGHCVKVVTGTANFSGGTFEAQEVAVFNMAGTVNITGGEFTSKDNAVISGNGTNEAKYQDGTISISGGTFNANIESEDYVACGIYHPQKGTLKVTGGTFNVNNGCGILMRGGSLDMTDSKASFNFTGNNNNNTGKVGDSRVVVPCGWQIVKDAYSAYYDAENITINGVVEKYIYNVENKQ